MADYSDMLQRDFEVRDNLQKVTLTNAITSVETLDVLACPAEISFRQAMLGGSLGLEPTDQRWLIGCRSLHGATINRGDSITTADGVVWVLLQTTLRSMGDTPVYYDCMGRRTAT